VSEVGELLRSARQKKHLTLPEVADDTRIKVQFLEALEDGNYGQIPGPAYVTGFLKNYARYLGLQADDMVQEFYSERPMPIPGVKPATRVLANGYERDNRRRVLWALVVVAAMLFGGYAIKLYNDTSAHAQPQLNVTPGNLGGLPASHPKTSPAVKIVRVQLQAIAPVWVQVTADGKQEFSGMMRPHAKSGTFLGHRAVYVITYDGARIKVSLNGRYLGFMSARPRLTVQVGTPTGWQRVS
jgi:transcriptional regulator with XRE-family HTH domain